VALSLDIILTPHSLTTEQIAAVDDHAANNSCTVVDVEWITRQIPPNQFVFGTSHGDSTRM